MKTLIAVMMLTAGSTFGAVGDVKVTWHREGSSTNTDAVLVIPVTHTDAVTNWAAFAHLKSGEQMREMNTVTKVLAALRQIYIRAFQPQIESAWQSRALWQIDQDAEAAKAAVIATNKVDIAE